MANRVTRYDLLRLKVGVIAAFCVTLGTKIPMVLTISVPASIKVALLFADVALGVGLYLGGFFTDNVKRDNFKERIDD